jgi:glycerol-3-phosphate acyltransferase PlsY
MELLKGFIAAWITSRVAGDPATAAASVGAVAGNVFNPYFRGRGGKGLGITAGVTLGAWPTFLPVVVAIVALSFVLLRRSGPATLIAAASYAIGPFIWLEQDLSTGWGVRPGPALLGVGIGIGLVLVPRALNDSRHPMTTNQEEAGDSALEN